jgi:hypothetical protein
MIVSLRGVFDVRIWEQGRTKVVLTSFPSAVTGLPI